MSRDNEQEMLARWVAKADENEDKWGHQRLDTLILAILEELGEVTQAYLETRSGERQENIEELQDEVDDLGALCVQFSRQLRRGQTPQDEQ